MKDSNELKQRRKEIDEVTHRLIELLNKRAAIALQIGKAKKDRQIYDPAREAAVLAAVKAANNGPLTDDVLMGIFKEIIAACRNIQQPLRVAYLGPRGTYSEEAALQYCGKSCQSIPGDSIDDVFHLVESEAADVAVVPVENSSEGSVNRTLDLLLQTPLVITGEIALPIHHQLLTHAAAMQDVREVIAHPQALAQCQFWLHTHLPKAKRTSAASNGAAARAAAQKKTVAAIASTRSAELYALTVLAKNIEDNPNNTTRFLVLGRNAVSATGTDKTSLICATLNQPGALRDLLAIFADEGVNLVKLESRPAHYALWHYVFYIDIEGHQTDAAMVRVLKKLRAGAIFVKLLGSYPKAVL